MDYGLSQNVIDDIVNVIQQYPVIESAILYGSRAKGNYKPTSDIDIVLKGKNVDLNILSKVAIKLDDLLLPNQFDLSIYHHINNQELWGHIARIGKIIYTI